MKSNHIYGLQFNPCNEYLCIVKLLITGATGFLGSHLVVQAIDLGYSVIATKRTHSNMELFDSVFDFYLNEKKSPLSQYYSFTTPRLNSSTLKSKITDNLVWKDVDLIDVDSLLNQINQPIDAIFNCASEVSFAKNNSDVLIENNVSTTRNLVNFAIKKNIKQFIHVSSIAALSRPKNSNIIDINTEWEDSPYNTDYAISKYLQELEVWRGKEEGLNIIIVNPGIILGYGKGKTSQHQLESIVKSKNPFYPIGSNGFIWVEELAAKMLKLFVENSINQRHLMVTHNLTYKSLFANIAKENQVNPPKIAIKGPIYGILLTLAKLCERIRVPFPISSDLLKSTYKSSQYKI